ncbi:MAG: metallophosphoesterase [Planctomycetota bacterium]
MSRHLTVPAGTLAAALLVTTSGLAHADSPETPAAEAFSLRFGLVADTNVSRREQTTRHWHDMIQLAQRNTLDFVVIAGDIVNNPRDEQQWERLGELLNAHDFRVETVPGNHEATIAHDDRENVFNRVFSLERYSAATGQPVNRSFREANAYFITLYSGGLKHHGTEWADFLRDELDTAEAEETIDWVFVVDHFDPRSECFPHATSRFGGFDRAALIADALEGHQRVIWLSGDLSSRYAHRVNDDAPPHAEFIPRENRSSPGFWQFTLYPDGRLTAQIIEAHTDKNQHRRVDLP